MLAMTVAPFGLAQSAIGYLMTSLDHCRDKRKYLDTLCVAALAGKAPDLQFAVQTFGAVTA